MGRVGWSDFIIWQCSLRQRNFRMFGGKPSEGTIASFFDTNSNIFLQRTSSLSTTPSNIYISLNEKPRFCSLLINFTRLTSSSEYIR